LISVLLYNLATQSYFFAIRLAAAFQQKKAMLWLNGRKGIFGRLSSELAAKRAVGQPLLWMHCASLGEFEQGRTVLEALKQRQPNLYVLLTFFSPSGYEVRKNYNWADSVFYLPADSKANAARFLDIVRPDLAIFVKYEFWYHYLHALHFRKVPSMLIAAVFRRQQPFFRWYGRLHRKILGFFSQILVQDTASLALLQEINLKAQLAGDPRVDRVLGIAEHPLQLPLVAAFCGDANVLVCGSTWPADEALLYPVFKDEIFKEWKFILAPHDVQASHIQAIEQELDIPYQLFSNLSSATAAAPPRLLLVDNIGLLSSLYQFGKIAYIGGGFSGQLHNTLEPAAFGLPIVFGPKFHKFEEAKWFVEQGCGFPVITADEIKSCLAMDRPKVNPRQWLEAQAGATDKVVGRAEELLAQNTHG
jgi:3-deoxy-D-manno-octulosonic-acid transferase